MKSDKSLRLTWSGITCWTKSPFWTLTAIPLRPTKTRSITTIYLTSSLDSVIPAILLPKRRKKRCSIVGDNGMSLIELWLQKGKLNTKLLEKLKKKKLELEAQLVLLLPSLKFSISHRSGKIYFFLNLIFEFSRQNFFSRLLIWFRNPK